MAREQLKRWFQGTAILGVGVLGFWLLLALRQRPVQLDPPRAPPVVSTQPARAGSGAIRVRGGGTVRPSAEVPIAAEVGGRVAWVSPAFVSGGRISRGEILLRIDTAVYQNAVDVALADVEQEQVDLLEAEAEVHQAIDEWGRMAKRHQVDSVSPNLLVTRQPQLEAAGAALRRAEALLDDARMALQHTSVRAPFDGIVREASVSEGRIVVPGEPLGRIYGADEVEVVVRLSDEDAALVDRLWDVRPGHPGTRISAEVSSDYGGTKYVWNAYVHRAELALHALTRMVTVVLRVPRPFEEAADQPGRPPLMIGSYATVAIEGRTFDHYAVIPAAALREGDVVWTVREDTLLAIIPVEPVQEMDAEATVLGPIGAGDLVVVSELPFVADGMAVRAVSALGLPVTMSGEDDDPADRW